MDGDIYRRPHGSYAELMGKQGRWFYNYVSPHYAEYLALARRLSDSTLIARRIVSQAEVTLLGCDHWEYITDPRLYMLRLVFDIAMQRLEALQPSITHYIAATPVDHFPPPETPADREMVLNALDQLPSLYRRAFLMRRVHGATLRELSSKLKVSPAKAQERLARAQAMFARNLDEQACAPERACALTDGYFAGRTGSQ